MAFHRSKLCAFNLLAWSAGTRSVFNLRCTVHRNFTSPATQEGSKSDEAAGEVGQERVKSSWDQGIAAQQREFANPLGGLQHLLRLDPWEEMLHRARKASLLVKEDMRMSGWKQKAQKMYAMRCMEYGNTLCRPLSLIINSYPRLLSPSHLHPFDLVVSRLLFSARERRGADGLEGVLASAKFLRKETQARAKAAAAKAKAAPSAIIAERVYVTLLNDLNSLWENNKQRIITLRDLEKDLRRIPVLDLTIPSAVLVGSPNVGKSSLVRAISTGTPEVQDYPFTTKGMTMGHVTKSNSPADPVLCQLMDTPGLLPRADEERNEMEMLTLASIRFLPTLVVFVLDLSGLAGPKSPSTAQLSIRQELRERFHDRPWIDILSKADLPREALSESDAALVPQDAISVSCTTGEGVEAFATTLEQLIGFEYTSSTELAAPAEPVQWKSQL